MRRTFSISMLLILGLMLASCVAGSTPKDSKFLGTYKGILWGNVFDGPIEVQLFHTADGETIFTGYFVNTIYGGEHYFRGSVTGSLMKGKISLVFGTITGELSEDRTQMSGMFRLAQNHGTWSATLR